MSHHYGPEYAYRYAGEALRRPYTQYKNDVVASIFQDSGSPTVLDVGGNVNGVFTNKGLRSALAEKGIGYVGLDLDPHCFRPSGFKVFKEEIYDDVDGIVADAKGLPFKDESFQGITCNDVIEHIEEPQVVLAEINRVLSPNGSAVVTVPSMYKLDGFNAPHIDHVRRSSHVNRFGLDAWVNLIRDSGFHIDNQQSRPIGVASGLTYLMWADQDFVPRRDSMGSHEEYSLLSGAHKSVKTKLGEHDALVDQFYANNADAKGELMSMVVGATSITDIYQTFSQHVGGEYDDDVINDLLLLGERAAVPEDRLQSIQNTMRYVGDLALGNSAVFVLNTSVE